jgi:hypothetical protein
MGFQALALSYPTWHDGDNVWSPDLPCPDSVAVIESGQVLSVSLPPTERTADGERQGTAQEPCHSCLRRYAYGAGDDCNALHP